MPAWYASPFSLGESGPAMLPQNPGRRPRVVNIPAYGSLPNCALGLPIATGFVYSAVAVRETVFTFTPTARAKIVSIVFEIVTLSWLGRLPCTIVTCTLPPLAPSV